MSRTSYKGMFVVGATLCALVAVVHLAFQVPVRHYPVFMGAVVPVACAILAIIDRGSIRPVWVSLVLTSFALMNAARLDAPWLIPVGFGAAAAWLFRASTLQDRDTSKRGSPAVLWISLTLLLVVIVVFGPEIIARFLGIPVVD